VRRLVAGSIDFGRPFLPAHALFELAHAATEGTAELGEPLGSEYHEDHDADEQQVERVLQAHYPLESVCLVRLIRSVYPFLSGSDHDPSGSRQGVWVAVANRLPCAGPSVELTRRSINGVVGQLNRPPVEEEGSLRDPRDVAGIGFPVGVWGYDRPAVDAYLEDVQRLVDDLRANEVPSDAVRRALDAVGEETSAILRGAYDAADEIALRSQEEADRRAVESELSAEEIRAAAEAQMSELDQDIDRVWAERQRLLDDVERTSRLLMKVSEAASRRFPAEQEPGEAPGASPPSTGHPVQADDPALANR